ncbi:putative disease resistance RPP13-like protein 1 [Rhododendron vialii]|uniref:putative disease resistance RPP13-like protein 1 n=1 Tax=Rhododendron vialii TaxID=182163 RepID=UPI0026605A21|nr:putative disease resistance RPP13-like protein 1 [Rhododendron vialii]
MAEVFLGAIVDVLAEKLGSGDLWNFARKERIDTQLRKLSSMLEQVQAVVADAEEKQITDRETNLWLSDLEDLSYDMDDILDEFATEALRQKVMEAPRASPSKVRKLIPNWFTSFNPSTLVSDFRMKPKMDEIDKITARLQDLFNRRMGLGLKGIAAGGSGKAPQRRPTSSLITEPCLYGRDNDKKAILELLLTDQFCSSKVGVVPIVGMGGVGKTTLAQMVYNDEMVDKHFEMKAWVCVSEVFNIVGATKAILESVTLRTCEFKSLDQVQVELKKTLAGKKFLIVLDDVWNKNHSDWSSLKSPFSDGALGSKVIVTTRIMDVAFMMAGPNKYHFLKELSEDECWSVFAQHAFEDRSMDSSDQNLVSIGREIVKKCEGLPLVARTLGGLLRCKSREDEWEGVLNSKIWELSEEESHILPALRLSYYHLPSHLKKCFAYCSILPKDYEFEEEELVYLWMAEGLIPKQTGQRKMEDLGCEYFQELLSRSFFQPSRSSELFVMHDLINDLAQFFASKTCFRLEDKLKENEGDESISKARHSSYTRGDRDGIKRFEAFKKAKNLRTFLPCGSRYQDESYLTSDVPLRLLPGLRRLRVLSLRRYKIGELSSSIGDLKHVRYLDLSCALILTLPESIGTLYNLQTLILRDCQNLNTLPANTSDLISLRHLDVTGANSLREMPPKIGKLTGLQTLSNFIVGNGNESMITELGNLIHLRGTLSVSGLENVTDALDAKRANLKDKQGLDVLLMKWSNVSDNARNGSVESKVLDILEPHKKLKKLSIYGYGGLKFPTWVGNSLFSNMVYLKFENCEKCTSLPPLGQLTSLAKLYIQGMKVVRYVGLEFYGLCRPNPFPALEILTFDDMPEWKDWTPFGAQAFARLSELSIKRCPKLPHELPRNLPRLGNLYIEECPVLVVAWIPSPAELNEVRNMLHFASLVSLHLKDVSIADSLGSLEAADQVVLKNSSHSLLSSLTFLQMENIQGTCLPSWVFQGLTRIQELSLCSFEELTTLWEDDERLQNCLPALRRLTIEGFPQLVSLFAEREEGDDLKSLQELSISKCPRLISFPVLPSTLKELRIDHCDGLVSLPDLTLLNNLEKLFLFSCPSLLYLTSGRGLPLALKELWVCLCAELKSLIAEEGIKINCPSLESVKIRECQRLKTLPDVMQNSNGLKNLSRLEICWCGNLESIPEGWFPTTNFREFSISTCEKLKPLPYHAYNNNRLASVKKLFLRSSPMATGLLSHILDEGSSSNFTNLTELLIHNIDIGKLCGLHRLYSLRELSLVNCDWVSFPEDEMLSFPSSLVHLGILCSPNLEKLSFKDFENLVSLEKLCIGCCPKLTSISELRLLPSLLHLEISDCPNLTSFPEQWLPPSLSHLEITGCPEFTLFPEQGLPPSLLDLWIFDCPNLASFPEQGLPPSLLDLGIFDCPNLASFPEQGLPPSLLHLSIIGCPILKRRCEKRRGQYWRFIAHIPEVEIDNRFVFDLED